MRARVLGWCLGVLLVACGDEEASDAGVGSSREGCGEPGTHSVLIGEYSCACEQGYEWCSETLDSFECCPIEQLGTDEGGELPAPDLPCDEQLAEQLMCVLDPADPSPGAAVVWACNGERWVEVSGYATFACMAAGLEFAYGCVPGPEFLCGFGPGSPCDPDAYEGLCVDGDIIDTCVWGRRTVDRCSRLCTELEVFGPGYTGGACEQAPDPGPASCVCE